MADTALACLPTERPAIHPGTCKSPIPFDWLELIGLTVHPLKVAILEALLWIGHPLSVSELIEVLADSHYSGDAIGYQATALANLGVIVVTDVRKVRGARENYFSIA